MIELRIISYPQFCDKTTLWGELKYFPDADWRPMCYDSQYNKLNGCDPMKPIVRTCQQCPFLADRHKSKVKL